MKKHKYHYTYRITNIIINKHYYGCRSSKIIPEKDLGIKYFSSSTDKDFINDQKENPKNYKYKIIRKFKTRNEALKLEIKLHDRFNVGINKSFYNKAKQTATGFSRIGFTKDNSGSNNPMYGKKHSDETKKKIGIKSIGRFKKHSIKNKERMSKIKLERDKNPEYYKKWKKSLKKGNKHPGSNPIVIFNEKDELIHFCHGNFSEFCKLNNLPLQSFIKSYKKETELYIDNLSPWVIKRLENNGNIKYKGWYARLC